jgi:hypothetical protein
MKPGKLLVNLGVLAAALVIIFMLLEGVLRLVNILGVPVIAGGETSYRRELELLAKQSSRKGEIKSPYMLLHPYFGYTNVPGTTSVHGVRVNNMGFATEEDFPYRKENDNEYVIAIMGGSVAEILSVMSTGTLVDTLEASLAFAGKEIKVINCATGAYKQPQQLLIITYLFSQGMDLDCVVNIDGFNEVSIAGINRKKGTNIFYPAVFYWNEMIHYLTSGTEGLLNNPRYIELIYNRSSCLAQRRKVLGLMLDSPLRHSLLARFILARRLGWVQGRQARIEGELKAISSQEASSWVDKMEQGPRRTDDLESAVACWARSSLLIKELCDDAGVLYVHLLQPNQYDPRGKTLTATEEELAYNPKSPFRNGGEWGYPLLREEIFRIEAGGVAFRDLGEIFNRVEGDIYVDDCCHFNKAGNDMVMEAIGGLIIEEITR